jgi:hypothetical protein
MYVVDVNDETGKLEPMHVSPTEFHARAKEIGSRPTQFRSMEAAQKACDKINNSTMHHIVGEEQP